MKPILERLKNGEILVADGAIGTMLMKKGLKPGDCPDSINLSKPEILEEIAQQYFDAGAEIIQTNTFGASPMSWQIMDWRIKPKRSTPLRFPALERLWVIKPMFLIPAVLSERF